MESVKQDRGIVKLWKKALGLLQARVGSAGYSAPIAFIALILGIIGSIFPEQLKFSVWPSGYWHINWVAWLFWTSVVVWFVLFWARQVVEGKNIHELKQRGSDLVDGVSNVQMSVSTITADTKAIQDANEKIQANVVATLESAAVLRQASEDAKKRIEEIDEAVHTMPGRLFVRAFCRQITTIHTDILPELPKQSDIERSKVGMSSAELNHMLTNLEEVIRTLLGMLVEMAESFDTRVIEKQKVRYAGNVMIFIPAESWQPYLSNLGEANVGRFLPVDYQESLKGILYLFKNLSAVSVSPENPSGSRDEGVEEMVFGIPKSFRDAEHRWTVLPGAPVAYVKWNSAVRDAEIPDLCEAVQGIDDIGELKQFVKEGIGEEKFNIPPNTVEQTLEYYSRTETGRRVKSFQSFPLVEEGTTLALGVVNLHCDRPVFLGGDSSAHTRRHQQLFAAVVSPIIFEIADVAKLWWTAKQMALKS